MVKHPGAVHVVTPKREYKGKTYVAHLLRRSYREDGKVKNETRRGRGVDQVAARCPRQRHRYGLPALHAGALDDGRSGGSGGRRGTAT